MNKDYNIQEQHTQHDVDDSFDPDNVSDDFLRQQEALWSQATLHLKPASVDHRAAPAATAPVTAPLTPQMMMTTTTTTTTLSNNATQENSFKYSASIADSDSNTDLNDLLQDQNMIEEQLRILEQIERERQQQQQQQQRMASTGTTSRATLPPSRKDDSPNEEDSSLIATLKRAALRRHTSLSTNTDDSSSSSLSSFRSSFRSMSTQPSQMSFMSEKRRIHDDDCDRVLRMGNRNLRVKGTRHAYQSIANGAATIVQCSSCGAILQVGATAKLVFCVHCEQVTPIESAREISSSSFSNRMVGISDSRIARSMQRQEMDVAYARKTIQLQANTTTTSTTSTQGRS